MFCTCILCLASPKVRAANGRRSPVLPGAAQAGVAALRAFARQYFPAWTPDLHEPLLRRLLEGLAPTKTPNVRRGVALGLGALPKAVLSHGVLAASLLPCLEPCGFQNVAICYFPLRCFIYLGSLVAFSHCCVYVDEHIFLESSIVFVEIV